MATGPRRYREVLLRPLLLRALNKNQILILSEVGSASITCLLKGLSKENRIPLSTLKLNAKILKGLGLVEYGQFRDAKLTDAGYLILNLIKNDDANR